MFGRFSICCFNTSVQKLFTLGDYEICICFNKVAVNQI